MIHPGEFTTEIRKQVWNYAYFIGGNPYGGYQLYYDTGESWIGRNMMVDRKVKSVLELGCGSGFTLRKLEGCGVTCRGFDVSRYCYLTRTTDAVEEFDVTTFPWPCKDGEFDFCFSDRLMEMIPEKFVAPVIKEIARVSGRGFHTVNSGPHDPIFQQVRATEGTQHWWKTQFRAAGASSQEVVDGNVFNQCDAKVLYNTGPLKFNFGSHIEMFHHNWGNADKADLTKFATRNHRKFFHHDVRAGVPVRANSTTAICALRILHQLTADEGRAFMGECYRMLMAGGVIRVSVPDYAKIKDMQSKVQLGHFDALGADIALANQDVKADMLLDRDRKSIYTTQQLIALMEKVGFTRVSVAAFGKSRSEGVQLETWDTNVDSTVIVEANKMVY